ncbi:hypothetical protein IEE94_01050 [Yimella sp. cx-573]|nr:hypothetical protein [Yimella sp. cx-573]
MTDVPVDEFGGETQVAPIRAVDPVSTGESSARSQHQDGRRQWSSRVVGSESETSGATTPVTGAAADPGARKSRGLSKLWLAAGVAATLAIGASAALLFWPDGSKAGDAGTSSGTLSLSNQPALKWSKTFAQIAPDFGCPASSSSDRTTDGPTCFGYATQAGDWVLANVTKSQTNTDTYQTTSTHLLAGVDTAGTTKWTVKFPEGQTVQCVAGELRLWCLTKSAAASGSSDSSDSSSSSAPSPSTLVTYDLSNGKSVSSIPVPSSGQSAAFAAVTPHAAYVAATNDSSSGANTMSKFGDNGKANWNKLLVLGKDQNAYGAVYEGKLYLYGSDSSGKQLILDDSSGELQPAEMGKIVGFAGGKVISQASEKGPLSVGKSLVAQDRVGSFSSYDKTPPLVLGTSTSDTTTYQVVDADKPTTIKYQLQGSPAYYCGGTIISSQGSSYFGIDDKGAAKWTIQATDSRGAWCADGKFAVSSARSLVGYDVEDGQPKFTTALPEMPSGGESGGGGVSISVSPELTSTGLAVSNDTSVSYVH